MSAVLRLIFWPRVVSSLSSCSRNFRLYIHLRGQPQGDAAERPKTQAGKGSGENGNQQYGLHGK